MRARPVDHDDGARGIVSRFVRIVHLLGPRGRWVFAIGMLVGTSVLAAPMANRLMQSRFPHEKHANVFPLCTSCHAGVTDQAQSIWPEPSGCAACHDGVIKPRIEWEPRRGVRATNLRFDHGVHSRAAAARDTAYRALIGNCSSCHTATGAGRMDVQHAVVGKCLACHQLRDAPHVDLPPQACATCHVRLTDAVGLTRTQIARFPRPTSHDAENFVLGGHGKLAARDGGAVGAPAASSGVAANCATCHARNTCVACHVNAPESAPIRALQPDERVLATIARQPVPASHASAGFLRQHGRDARGAGATCATCHTRASCTTCHVESPPAEIGRLAVSGPGRAAGAQLTRTPPASHVENFRTSHGPEANARPQSCASCHERATCLQCHRPENGRPSRFHPQNFLTRHPASAWSREANCSDCHNPGQFCQSCHQQAGLVAASRIGRKGFHDAFRGFSLGHGQAARQSLESCASCHAERDCTACHSAVGGGFRFSPHGPGFNAARMQAKNASLCIACHGRGIPPAR